MNARPDGDGGGDDLADLAAGDGGPPVAGRLAAGAALAGGRYTIVGLIGRTAFGEVYRATDRSSGHAVALRLLAPELTRDPAAEGRLRQLQGALARLDHKNIAHTTRYTNLAPDRFKTFWRD